LLLLLFLLLCDVTMQQVLEQLLPRLSSANAVNPENKHSALMVVCRLGFMNCVKLLCSRGARVEYQCPAGLCACAVAIYVNQTAIARYLMERQSSPLLLRDRMENSLLHISAVADDLEIAKVLIRAGVPSNCLNVHEKSPLEVSKSSEMCRILLGSVVISAFEFCVVLCCCDETDLPLPLSLSPHAHPQSTTARRTSCWMRLQVTMWQRVPSAR